MPHSGLIKGSAEPGMQRGNERNIVGVDQINQIADSELKWCPLGHQPRLLKEHVLSCVVALDIREINTPQEQ